MYSNLPDPHKNSNGFSLVLAPNYLSDLCKMTQLYLWELGNDTVANAYNLSIRNA